MKDDSGFITIHNMSSFLKRIDETFDENELYYDRKHLTSFAFEIEDFIKSRINSIGPHKINELKRSLEKLELIMYTKIQRDMDPEYTEEMSRLIWYCNVLLDIQLDEIHEKFRTDLIF
jgi:hypothetical protein